MKRHVGVPPWYTTRDFQHWRRRRRGRSLVKKLFIFYLEMSQQRKSVQWAYRSKNLLWLSMHRQRSIKKKETKNLASRFYAVLRKKRRTLIVISRCCFVEDGKEIPRFKTHVHSCSSAHKNLLFGDTLVAVDRRRRRVLLKLPNIKRKVKKVKPWSQGWLMAAWAYPGFCSMKRLEVFLLPVDGMLVHHRSLPRNFVRFPQQFAGTHLYSWAERGIMRVK